MEIQREGYTLRSGRLTVLGPRVSDCPIRREVCLGCPRLKSTVPATLGPAFIACEDSHEQ